jgi:hypothetical protein|tara:strand:- start:10269 stop:11174 length:906 start_codon:yes stop_codon:yes gene_type:complete
MADPLYHVTFSKNLPEIQKRGLDPLSGSLWQKAETEKRYQDQPSVFSFQDPEEALLWASKMGWEFRDEISDPSDISIVKLRGGDHWEPDPAAGGPDIGKTSMRSLGPVPFSDILEVISLPKPAGGNEEFQARHPRGNLQQWLKFYGNRLRGQEPRTTPPDQPNLPEVISGSSEEPEEYQVLDEALQYWTDTLGAARAGSSIPGPSLKGTEFNPFGMDKPGIEYFKEWLGISPEDLGETIPLPGPERLAYGRSQSFISCREAGVWSEIEQGRRRLHRQAFVRRPEDDRLGHGYSTSRIRIAL